MTLRDGTGNADADDDINAPGEFDDDDAAGAH